MSLRSLFIKGEAAPTRPQSWPQLDRRVGSLPSHELATWANNTLYAIGRNLSEYQKDPSRPEFLDEAVEGSRVLVRLVEEIKRRG